MDDTLAGLADSSTRYRAAAQAHHDCLADLRRDTITAVHTGTDIAAAAHAIGLSTTAVRGWIDADTTSARIF